MDQVGIFIALNLLSVLIALFVALVSWQKRQIAGGLSLFWLMVAVALWGFFSALEISAHTINEKIFWSKAAYLGTLPVPVLLLIFAASYTGKKKWLTRRNIAGLFIIPGITFLITLFNEQHGLVWNSFIPSPYNPRLLQYGHGPIFWLNVLGYSYLCILVGTMIILRSAYQKRHTYRLQSTVLLFATLIPWAGNVLYISGLNPLPGIDLTAIAFSLSGVCVAFAIFRYRLLDLVPIARDILVNNMQDGVIVLDSFNRIIDINPSALQLIHCQIDQVLGKEISEVMGKPLGPVQQTDPSAVFVLQIDWGESQEVILDINVSPICDRNDACIGRLLCLRDVTERKRLEQELSLKSLVLDQIHDHVTITDLSGNITYVNEAEIKTIGLSFEQIVGKTTNIYGENPEKGATQREIMENTLRDGSWRCEVVNYANDGSEHFMDCRTQVIQDIEGNPIALCGVATDITERKRVEEALRASEGKYQQLVENTADWVWAVDLENVHTYSNSAVFTMLGYQASEVVGGSMYPLVHPEDVPLIKEMLRHSIEHRTGWRDIPIRLLHKDGTARIFESTAAPIFNDDGKMIGLSGVDRDITERKQMENALHSRLVALTRPLDQPEGIQFSDLFDLDEIQRLQDQFSAATGVASVITYPDGTPITQPSNFCRLCSEIIRKTEKGKQNCFQSDAIIGKYHPGGPIIQPCMSGGLWDAGAGISVGGRHIANWLIGQVRNEAQSERKIREYARKIGVDENDAASAFQQVPAMSLEEFSQVANALFTMAKTLSDMAYQNVQQARFITERKRAEEALRESEELFKSIIAVSNTGAWVYHGDTDYLWCSPEYFTMLGRSLEEFVMDGVANLQETWIDLIHPDDRQKATEWFTRYLREGSVGMYENFFRMQRADGGWAWIWSRGQTLRNKDGSLTDITVGTHIDITERKQAEDKILEQLAELKRWQNATLGREDRILELKREINRLLIDAGKPARFTSVVEESHE